MIQVVKKKFAEFSIIPINAPRSWVHRVICVNGYILSIASSMHIDAGFLIAGSNNVEKEGGNAIIRQIVAAVICSCRNYIIHSITFFSFE